MTKVSPPGPQNSVVDNRPAEESNKDEIVKALKLFAKNHKRLDRVYRNKKSPIFGRRKNKKVDRADAIKASTRQKSGEKPKGPIIQNQRVDYELLSFKAKVEECYSYGRTRNYKFPRYSDDEVIYTANT